MISVREYDMAMLDRFRCYFSNSYWVNKPNLAITEIRSQRILEGKDIEFPLLTVRRTSCPILSEIDNTYSRQLRGMSYGKEEFRLVSCDFDLKYSIDVFAYERDNFDELVVELIENLVRNPYLNFSDNDSYPVKGAATFIQMEEVEDNTDIESFVEQNPLYRASIALSIRAQIHRKFRTPYVGKVDIDYNILNNSDGDDKPYIPSEDSIVDSHVIDKEYS